MMIAAFLSKDPQIKLCESCLTGLLTGGSSCCCSALNATSRLLIAAAVATGQCWHWICQRCWHLSLLLLLKRPKLSNSVPTCWCEEPSLLMTATHSKYVWSQLNLISTSLHMLIHVHAFSFKTLGHQHTPRLAQVLMLSRTQLSTGAKQNRAEQNGAAQAKQNEQTHA